MGREMRRVPPDWKHPKDEVGRYIPMFGGRDVVAETADWNAQAAMWAAGAHPDQLPGGLADEEERKLPFAEWHGDAPDPERYMPVWPPEVATHFMMYEDTSEGTPISPAFATPEELARWLVDNNASTFGSMTGTYEGWLAVAKGGWAPSMVTRNDGRGHVEILSGVEFAAERAVSSGG